MRQQQMRTSGSGALDVTITAPGSAMRVLEAKLALSAPGVGAVSFGVDAAAGAAHDLTLYAHPVHTGTDHYVTDLGWRLLDGDALTVSWANTGGVSWALEVVYEA